MLAHCGVTECPEGDFARDHLSRVESDSEVECHVVGVLDGKGQVGRLLLDAQRGEARTDGMVFERERRAEHRHDPVAGELVHRSAVAFDDEHRTVDQVGHDLAEPFSTDGGGEIHRMDHVGE